MSDPQPPAGAQPEPPYGDPGFPPPPPAAPYGTDRYTPPGPQFISPTAPVMQPAAPGAQPGVQAPYPGAPMYSAGQPAYPGAPGVHPGVWAPAPTAVRPLRGIGTATRILIAVYAALSLVTLLTDGWGIMTLDAYNSGSVGADALDTFDGISLPLSVIAMGVLIAAGICWVVWQYRAAASVPPGGLRRSPGWHVGSWFIPVVSLFFPFQNISDLARSSRADLSGGLRGTWWTLWIASNLVGSIAGQAATAAKSIPGLTGALAGSMLSELLAIGAAVFAWIIVARITEAIDPQRR